MRRFIKTAPKICYETKFWGQSVSGNHHTVFMRRFDETLILFTYAQLLKKYSIIYKTAPKIQNCPQTSLCVCADSACLWATFTLHCSIKDIA